jgi:hypothetical protein
MVLESVPPVPRPDGPPGPGPTPSPPTPTDFPPTDIPDSPPSAKMAVFIHWFAAAAPLNEAVVVRHSR